MAFWLPLYRTIPLITRKRHDEVSLQASQVGGKLVSRSHFRKQNMSFLLWFSVISREGGCGCLVFFVEQVSCLLLILLHFFQRPFYLLEVTTWTGFQGYLLVKLYSFIFKCCMDIELDRMCAAWMNCDIDYIILRYLAVLAIPIKYD